MIAFTKDRLLLLGQVLGCVYVVLLGMNLALPHRLLYCDLLCPAMLVLALCKAYSDKRETGTVISTWFWQDIALLAFILSSLVSVALHIFSGGAFLPNIFEWCVFLYCVLLFAYFRIFPLTERQRLCLGTCILSAFLLCWMYGIVASFLCNDGHPLFWEMYGKMKESSMPFLSSRYTFTFGNPNLAAPYCTLGALMVASGIESSKRKLPYILLVCVGLLPIACTMSKHGVLYLAVLLFLIARQATRLLGEKWAKYIALMGLVLVICAFEVTVVFVTFPLKGEFPYINTQPGMYSIHQGAYFSMLSRNKSALGNGLSVEKLRELYPQCVNKESAHETLKYYNSEKDLDSFCAYMDPHCEYLNLMTLFGVLPLVFMLLYLVYFPRRGTLGLLWTTVILGCMLWDDVLSKRWIWIGLAITIALKEYKGNKNEIVQQRASVGRN